MFKYDLIDYCLYCPVIKSTGVALGVSATTISAGVGISLNWIPDDIGKLATLVGIALSVLLIFVHIVKLKHSINISTAITKKAQFELEVMIQKEKERQDLLLERANLGEPLRRSDDSVKSSLLLFQK